MRAYALSLLLLLRCSWCVALSPRPADTPPDHAFRGQNTLYGPIDGQRISRKEWTVLVDSEHPSREGTKSIDDDFGSTWETEHNATKPHPHYIIIDMKLEHFVNGFSYLPRQDGALDGNVGAHELYLSMDGESWKDPVAFGTFRDDNTNKNTSFPATKARFVRFNALTEAGGRVPYTSASEFHVYHTTMEAAAPGPPNTVGQWSATINFPLVPVAVAVDVNTGNILTWSSYQNTYFKDSNDSQTVTATYNPYTGSVSQEVITNTDHDMFCPGISMDVNGRAVVTGGNSANRTSIYTTASNSWFEAATMNIPRGYQASVTCSDGRVFVIGGSFSGGKGGKNGEIYNSSANTWTLLPGCPVKPMLTNDTGGIFRQDNHGWLFGWRNNYVFQAGLSKAMNWYGMEGDGSQVSAGTRASDGDAMCGDAIMYDAAAGSILTLGGAPDYGNSSATNAAHIIRLGSGGGFPVVDTILPGMAYNRTFANAVALPNGNVFVNGGQYYTKLFSDDYAIMVPEIWHMADSKFYSMATGPTPRTYHSIAVLMLDGRVFSGGGGLCGNCSANHLDAQIFSPPYLFNSDGSLAPRPVINSTTPTTVSPGATITIQASTPISTMSMVRYGATTHTVNTDQRRIGLNQTQIGTNKYTVVVPNDPGIALLGYWMLFVMNSAGTPSIADTIRVL